MAIVDRSIFPKLSSNDYDKLLAHPEGKIRMVLDTDTANEIDDQFALAWALLSPDKIELEAVTTEPFSFRHYIPMISRAKDAIVSGKINNKYDKELVIKYSDLIERFDKAGLKPEDMKLVDAKEGEYLSYNEIIKIFNLLDKDPSGLVFHGSQSYLESVDKPIESESAQRIIELALKDSDRPLYVSGIGCVTNLASALLMEPSIIKNVVFLWTSGFPIHSKQANTWSLNLNQDVIASKILFESGVPLVYLPGFQVGSHLTLSLNDMEKWMKGRGKIGDYLYYLYTNNPIHKMNLVDDIAWKSWVIWDIINIAYLINPLWVRTDIFNAVTLNDGLNWVFMDNAHPIREAYEVNRDAIFYDFFQKLNTFTINN